LGLLKKSLQFDSAKSYMLDDIKIVLSELTIGIDFEFLIENALNVFLSLVIYFVTRILFKEKWIFSYTQLLVAIFLPIVAYLITTIISSNIALSLGMIGALSIIRFRTPVKSPFELVLYFIYLTIGITSSVNINLSINFTVLYVVLISLLKFSNFSESDNFNLFNNLNDDNSVYLNLEIRNKLDFTSYKVQLVTSKYYDDTYFYTLKSPDINVIEQIIKEIDGNNLISYSIDV